MLEELARSEVLPKGDAAARLAALRSRLFLVQRACWDSQLGSLLVFEGWDGAGKAATIREVIRELEPRAFRVHGTTAPRSHEQQAPWLWRFWNRLPRHGEMAIFDESWYRRTMVERVEGHISTAECRRAYAEIRRFERTLTDEGYVVIKFFLHIGRKEQRARLEKLQADPLRSHAAVVEAWRHHKQYARLREAIDQSLRQTETAWAPWTVVDARDAGTARVTVLERVCEQLEQALRTKTGAHSAAGEVAA